MMSKRFGKSYGDRKDEASRMMQKTEICGLERCGCEKDAATERCDPESCSQQKDATNRKMWLHEPRINLRFHSAMVAALS